jgi:2-desacetyl-2-hydroxyethyl bacteriochlorophyllide A dehydrogenase
MQARAIVVTAKDTMELRSFELRSPHANEVLLEALYTCISPGTELRCLRGAQAGTKYPFIPGYAFVGRVISAGAEAKLSPGTLVLTGGTRHAEGLHLLWGGHCSHAVVPAADVYPLPAGVDPLEASLCRLGSIAFHGMRLSKPCPNERVAVLGLGPIGQMAALMHGLAGAQVVAYDRSPERMASARAIGITTTPEAADPKSAFAGVFPGGADIVVDATGAPQAVPSGIELARDMAWNVEDLKGARYLVQGSYAEGFTIPYEPAFFRELTFLIPRDTVSSDRTSVLDLLGRKQLAFKAMITAVRAPEQATETYQQLIKDPKQVTAAFRWKA